MTHGPVRSWFDRYSIFFVALFVVLFLSATILPLSTPPLFMRSKIVADPYAGLTIEKPSLLTTETSPPLFELSPFQRGRLTIELDVTPADTRHRGAARLVAYSRGSNRENWIVIQQRDQLHVEYLGRTAGLKAAFRSGERQHFVIIVTDDGMRVFRSGIMIGLVRWSGDPQPWKPAMRVSVGNDVTGDRPWRGTIHRLKFYDTPLTLEAAQALFRRPTNNSAWPVPFAQLKIGQGSDIFFDSPDQEPVAVHLYAWPGTLKLRQFLETYKFPGKIGDAVRNFLFLIPLGFFMAAAWREKPLRLMLTYVVMAQFSLSLFAEMMQFLSPVRVATIRDVVTNTARAFTGAWLWYRTRPKAGSKTASDPTTET